MSGEAKKPQASAQLQGRASLAIAALALIAVVLGLILGGGPMQARKERRDDMRLDDLMRLSNHINCLAVQGDRIVMPTDFAPTDGCPGPIRMADPYTDAPYRIEALADNRYRLCAGFELPADENRPRWAPRRRDGDCVVQDLPRRAADQFEPMDQPEVIPSD